MAGVGVVRDTIRELQPRKVVLCIVAIMATVGVILILLGTRDEPEVTIYSSLPLQGTQRKRSQDMVLGMELALQRAHNKAGKFHVTFRSLDDSMSAGHGVDPGICYTQRSARGEGRQHGGIHR